MQVTVIGDGGWGTAIALLLAGYGHDLTVWGPFEDYLQEVRASGVNSRYLPGIDLPTTITWSSDLAQATANAELIVLAIPSHFFRDVCTKLGASLTHHPLIVSLTKGFDPTTHHRMSEVARETLSGREVVVLSGPSHAEEVARAIPTAVTVASTDKSLALRAQAIFNGPRFRVYTTQDVLGVEIGGAIKNVIAVAVGVSDGLGFGDNTRAALITRGLREIVRLGQAMGAQADTLSGLAGIGDLIVTCTSEHSRNHQVGVRLGKGEAIKTITQSMKMVAEGVWNAQLVHELAAQNHVEMPISELVYQMCYCDLSVATAFEMIMTRDAGREIVPAN